MTQDDAEKSLEAAAYRISDSRNPADQLALTSIAISLKRIADAMTSPVNEYGETMAEAIAGNIQRALRDAASLKDWNRS
jgi:hypothetical protein